MEEQWRTVEPVYQVQYVAIYNQPFLLRSLITRPFTEKQLLEAISAQIQRNKPDNIPKPPYTTTAPNPQPQPTPKPTAKSKNKATAPAPQQVQVKAQGRRHLPIPPSPQPQLVDRVSQYSPAIASGVLVDTVKAGMAAEANAAPGAAAGAVPGATTPGTPGAGVGKGKRKVLRVRG